MKNLIKFLSFIFYSTSVFFFPNNIYTIFFLIINSILMIILRKNIRNIINKTFKIFPFILFTFVINCFMDDIINAFWIGGKLIIVCNATIIYAITTTTASIAETVKLLCSPLKIFKINTDEIKIMVCISLSMFPILRKDLYEIKEACISRGMKFNIKNTKNILSKYCLSIIKRVNYIEEALIAKGYENS